MRDCINFVSVIISLSAVKSWVCECIGKDDTIKRNRKIRDFPGCRMRHSIEKDRENVKDNLGNFENLLFFEVSILVED